MGRNHSYWCTLEAVVFSDPEARCAVFYKKLPLFGLYVLMGVGLSPLGRFKTYTLEQLQKSSGSLLVSSLLLALPHN